MGQRYAGNTDSKADFVCRARSVGLGVVDEARRAVISKDFESFARLMMGENIALIPALDALNQAVVESITAYNTALGGHRVCFTVNQEGAAVAFTLQKYMSDVLKMLAIRLPPTEASFDAFCPQLCKFGIVTDYGSLQVATAEAGYGALAMPGAVERIVVLRPGQGAQLISLAGRLKEK